MTLPPDLPPTAPPPGNHDEEIIKKARTKYLLLGGLAGLGIAVLIPCLFFLVVLMLHILVIIGITAHYLLKGAPH